MIVDAVIVAYNSRDILRACVEPLAQLPWVDVTVVDNASPDDSASAVADLPIHIIRAPRNGGFAYGCNVGLAAGTAEFVLFVNPDARIESASLRTLVNALQADPRLGGVGPLTIGEGGQLHCTQRRFPRLRSTYAQALGLHRVAPFASWTGEVIQERAAYTRPGMPDWLSGSCVLIRRAALDEVGGMDEGFFLYSEETDLFRRMRRRGWRARFEPRATAYHQGYGSAPWETAARSWPKAASATRASITARWSRFWRQSASRPMLSRAPPPGFAARSGDVAIWRQHERRSGQCARRTTREEVAGRRGATAIDGAGARAGAGIGRARRAWPNTVPGPRRDVRTSRRGAARLAQAPRLRRPGTGISGTPA